MNLLSLIYKICGNPYSQPCMCMIDLNQEMVNYTLHQFFVQIEYLKVVEVDYGHLTEMGPLPCLNKVD